MNYQVLALRDWLGRDLRSVAVRNEGVESLDKGRVTVEDRRHTLNDAWGVDATP